MSHFTNTVVLDVQYGHWQDICLEAIKIAKMLDKNVQFTYNGVQIKLNKNSTTQCFIKQYGSGTVAVENNSN